MSTVTSSNSLFAGCMTISKGGNQEMKKKLLGAVLSVAMVATLLSGCGGSAASSEAAPEATAATE